MIRMRSSLRAAAACAALPCRGGSPLRSALMDRRFILHAIRFIFLALITHLNVLKIRRLPAAHRLVFVLLFQK